MRFHCNHCFTKDVDGVDVYNKFYQTNRKDAFIRHLQSPKHLKCIEVVKQLSDEQKTKCACCGKIMSNDSYQVHYRRNKILIDWFSNDDSKTGARFGKHHYYDKVFRNHYTSGEITCDEYKFGAKRFESLEKYLDFIVKRKKYQLDG